MGDVYGLMFQCHHKLENKDAARLLLDEMSQALDMNDIPLYVSEALLTWIGSLNPYHARTNTGTSHVSDFIPEELE